MTEQEDAKDAPGRSGGIYSAYCDTDGVRIGGATLDRAAAEREADAHARKTGHTTSVLTL